ncbi:MAG: DUF3311 domain-containing protein [Nocardioides sp.]|jgi:hypothetical protein
MTDSRPPRAGTSTGGLWTLICVLLAPAVIVPLLVPLYDSEDPTLFGFPFYYWFQLALIPVAVILTGIAFVLAKGADRRDREAHGTRRGESER